MLNDNAILNFDSFSMRIITKADKGKEIIIHATREADGINHEQCFRFSESEVKYLHFEHIKVLEYIMGSFVHNMRKPNHDS